MAYIFQTKTGREALNSCVFLLGAAGREVLIGADWMGGTLEPGESCTLRLRSPARRACLRRLRWARRQMRGYLAGYDDLDCAMDACQLMSRPAMDADPDGCEWVTFRALNACATMLTALDSNRSRLT